jgi:hypothetical protein
MKTTLALLPSLLFQHASADTPAYCDAHAKDTKRVTDKRFTPPIPCTGEYAANRGICCPGKFSYAHGACKDGAAPLWTLPLAPCVTQHPQWSGCPGNMMDGLCCSGADFVGERVEKGEFKPAECAGGGTALFSVTKLPNGQLSTTTLPPGMRSVAATMLGVGVVVGPDGSSRAFTIGDPSPTAKAQGGAPGGQGGAPGGQSGAPGGQGGAPGGQGGAPGGQGGAPAAPKEAAKKAGAARTRGDGGMVLMSGLAVAGAIVAVVLL